MKKLLLRLKAAINVSNLIVLIIYKILVKFAITTEAPCMSFKPEAKRWHPLVFFPVLTVNSVSIVNLQFSHPFNL